MAVDCDTAEVGGLLSSNFGETITVSNFDHAPDGGHKAEHFVAHFGELRRFGLKVAGNEAVRARLASEVALLLKAPNAARTAIDRVCKLSRPPELTGKDVLKTEWLSGQTASFKERSTLDSVASNLVTFFEQYGEWAATALFLGIADRDNPGNWAWDAAGHRLQMIDFESSFGQCEPASLARFLTREDTRIADRTAWKKDRANYPKGLMTGFMKMRQRIRTEYASVEQLIRGCSLESLLPGLEVRKNRADDETFQEVISSVAGP